MDNINFNCCVCLTSWLYCVVPYQNKPCTQDSLTQWDVFVVQVNPKYTEGSNTKIWRACCDTGWKKIYPQLVTCMFAACRDRENQALQREAADFQMNIQSVVKIHFKNYNNGN